MKKLILFIFLVYTVNVIGQDTNDGISRKDTIVIEVMNLKREMSNARNEFEKYRGVSKEADELINKSYQKIEEEAAKEYILGESFSTAAEFILHRNQTVDRIDVIWSECISGLDSVMILAKKQRKEEEAKQRQEILNGENGASENLAAKKNMPKINNLSIKYYRAGPTGNKIETIFANRATKAEVCFDIDGTIKGGATKTLVYLVVKDINGNVILDGQSNKPTFKTIIGKEQVYTKDIEVVFPAHQKTECFGSIGMNGQQFSKGTYFFEIYIDGIFLSATHSSLR